MSGGTFLFFRSAAVIQIAAIVIAEPATPAKLVQPAATSASPCGSLPNFDALAE